MRKGLRSSIFPPRTGTGNGSTPDARRNRTGGVSTIRQPAALDLDRAPFGVAEVEVELAVQTGDTGMNLALVGVIMGFGFNHVERRRHGFRARSAVSLVEESPRQPAAESPRTNEPRLAVALDVEVGVAGQVGRMKQIGGLGEPEQDVGLRLRPRVGDAASALFGERVIERGDAAAGALESGPQGLEGGAIGFL